MEEKYYRTMKIMFGAGIALTGTMIGLLYAYITKESATYCIIGLALGAGYFALLEVIDRLLKKQE